MERFDFAIKLKAFLLVIEYTIQSFDVDVWRSDENLFNFRISFLEGYRYVDLGILSFRKTLWIQRAKHLSRKLIT